MKNIMDNNNQTYDYISEFTIGENEHYEFSKDAYYKPTKWFAVLFIIALVITIPQAFTGDFLPSVSAFGNMLLIFTFIMFSIESRTKTNYQRNTFIQNNSELKSSDTNGSGINYSVKFSDKISVCSALNAPISYDYSLVSAIRESASFYLLILPHNLRVLVKKESLCNYIQTDFVNYIFDKCQNIKKKKISKIDNCKKIYRILLTLSAILFFVFIFIFIVKFWNDIPQI